MPRRTRKAKTTATKKRLTPEQKATQSLQRSHKKLIRDSFAHVGFRRVSGLEDRQVTFYGQTGDFDDLFILENLFVFTEYTVLKSDAISDHLKKKDHFFRRLLDHPQEFIEYLKTTFPSHSASLTTPYHRSTWIVRILYCPRNDLSQTYRDNIPGPIYFNYPEARYFKAITDSIRKSAAAELLAFLQVPHSDLGSSGTISLAPLTRTYEGSLLPESHSHFRDGYKVVTFYAEPESLLNSVYVLRKDGWKDSDRLYQRMLSKSKIDSIRTYLRTQQRVFINNIIVTLPADVRPLDAAGNTIDASSLTKSAPVRIQLPTEPNTIGIVDGQHRVFAYHESVTDDASIALLRRQQNLLVTGIIYPPNTSEEEKEEFEARLFLEINSNQTSAKTDLKQAIGLVLDPFSNDSVAAQVLKRLARSGPLAGHVEQYFFDTNKLKPSSVISYGLKPLVKFGGSDSLFSLLPTHQQTNLAEGSDRAALGEYISFCAKSINGVLSAFKSNLPQDRWTTHRSVDGRLITTTYINCFLITARLLIDFGESIDSEVLTAKLADVRNFDFKAYRSSQYKRMADAIVSTYLL